MRMCQAPGCKRKVPDKRGPLARYCSASCTAKSNVYATRRRRQALGLRVDQPLSSLQSREPKP